MSQKRELSTMTGYSGVASSISEGDIFIYSCSEQLSSFEIDLISKELNCPEQEYMNMSPSLIELATPLTGYCSFLPVLTRNYVTKHLRSDVRNLITENLLATPTQVIPYVSGIKWTIIKHPLRVHSSQITLLKRQPQLN